MIARQRIAGCRLYLVCDARPEALLRAALRGGADLLQLRDKALDDDGVIAAARAFRAAADAFGVPFILNDRPDLVAACRADGVHVGQDDMSPSEAREIVGAEAIVGLSTHAPAEFEAGQADEEVDYVAVGPVNETPTKAGRPAAGLDYVSHAAEHSNGLPWFAIGGLHAGNLHTVTERGARRVVVVRAIADAPDPEDAASALRAGLDAHALV
jgi:thiamine-phosphate pyrophosphorylase